MGEIPFGFILILLGLLVGALVFAVAAFMLKARRVQRLKHPHRDYLKERG